MDKHSQNKIRSAFLRVSDPSLSATKGRSVRPIFSDTVFILCWRCTGVVIGFLAGITASFFFDVPFHAGLAGVFCLMLIPLIYDSLQQHFFDDISNNKRRFITGLLFGLSVAMLCDMFF